MKYNYKQLQKAIQDLEKERKDLEIKRATKRMFKDLKIINLGG